jgi:hypothetical protein
VKYYVYIFRNPLKNLDPFYVGKGSGYRYKHPQAPCMLKRNDRKSQTLRSIEKAGLKPTIDIIPCADEQEALSLETELIVKYKRVTDGGTLLNILSGGDNPPKNKGPEHPKYGSGKTYKVTNLVTGESEIVNAIYHWAKQRNLNASALVEIASGKIIKTTPGGFPVCRKSHKHFTCQVV